MIVVPFCAGMVRGTIINKWQQRQMGKLSAALNRTQLPATPAHVQDDWPTVEHMVRHMYNVHQIVVAIYLQMPMLEREDQNTRKENTG